MSNSNEPAAQSATSFPCPLARDQDGHPVELPEGAAAWRVRRHTGGRPRIQLGADKQPMQLPLGYTIVDVEDILSPGAYRLDAVDQKGEPLGLTVPIAIGQLRNIDDAERDEGTPAADSAILPATGSDTRLVLESNVRATQMAFLHNQKTLELGLRMAESLRDGVRVMAESQADWIKSMASARGFFRNSAPSTLPPSPQPKERDSEDDEEDEDDDDETGPAKEDRLVEFGITVATLVNTLVETLRAPNAGGAKPAKASKFDLASLLDWRRAVPAAPNDNAPAEPPSPAGPADLFAILRSLPPDVRMKLLSLRSRFTPEEQSRMLQLVGGMPPDDLAVVAAEIATKSEDEIFALFRTQLDQIGRA